MNRKARRADKARSSPGRPSHVPATVAAAVAHLARGDSAAAGLAADRALKETFHSVDAYAALANVLVALDRREDAVLALCGALSLEPRHFGILNNLAFLLTGLGRAAEAVDACRRAIAIDPAVPEAHYNLGCALRDLQQTDEAIAAFRQAAALRPDNAEAWIALGNILMERNQVDEAGALFTRAYRLRPLSRRPAAKRPPDFSALLVTVPGLANTPSDYLLRNAAYDSVLFALMEGAKHDIAQLRRCGDVVVNLLSDVDVGRAMLPQVTALVDELERPTINHPSKILATGREEIAARLSGIPHCRAPRTARIAGAALTAAADNLAGFSFPVLVRVSGTHGGHEFEKAENAAAVAAFVGRKPGAEYYVTEYVPYESADGRFRKYRLIFVGDQILPYHLAIDTRWKVHHFRTDMANQEWMRKEEEAFVSSPSLVFRPEHWAAMETIRKIIGLDYFGIDCALDRAGDLVVFEVNATMLVHGETGVFGYKEPYIARIKQAFDALLAKTAAQRRL